MSAQISVETSFEMMFMLAQMTDVHYPMIAHAHKSTRVWMPECQLQCTRNDLELQGQFSLDWKKCRNTLMVARANSSGVAMPSVALLW